MSYNLGELLKSYKTKCTGGQELCLPGQIGVAWSKKIYQIRCIYGTTTAITWRTELAIVEPQLLNDT